MIGGCLCGKVRYKILFPVISQGVCYCRQCQKTGGSCGSAMMVIYKNGFEYPKVSLASYETKSDRGATVMRSFCRECGSQIFAEISDISEILTVKAATLDDVNAFVPEYLVWTQSAGASCVFPPGIPSFPKNAPLEMMLDSKKSHLHRIKKSSK